MAYTHKVHLPPADAALLHILTEVEVKRLVQTEMFATAVCGDDEEIAEYGLKNLYARQVTMGDFTIFWDRKK